MRSVKITIPGKFWDSQVYSGEIMLFTDTGSLHRFDWRSAIDSFADANKHVRTALRVAFVDGDLFYNEKVRKILLDPELARPIKSQLDILAGDNLILPLGGQSNATEVDSPFDFVPTDTEIYYNTLFASGDDGLFTFPRTSLGRHTSKKRPDKHHDARILQIKASDRHTALAAAAGADGLMEFGFERIKEDVDLGQERRLAARPCSACEWSFQSVMGWSESAAFLANFKEERMQGTREKVRLFDRVIDFSEIFGNDQVQGKSFSWGSREKLYRIGESGVSVAERLDEGKRRAAGDVAPDPFKVVDIIDSDLDSDDVIATGTAPFGTVVELSDRLVVMRSDGAVDEFNGELVHWRIFPRSSHYSNQLHLIYESHIEIVSFVHDYFVDQVDKKFGFSKQVDVLANNEVF